MEPRLEISVRRFITNIPEDTLYFCNPDVSVVVFPEENKLCIDPYGEASSKYSKELNLVCPIKKVKGKITVLPDPSFTHTPYHKSHLKVVESIKTWLVIQNIATIVTDDKGYGVELPYETMDIVDLEATLVDWLQLSEEREVDPHGLYDVEQIRKIFLKQVAGEKNKERLHTTWNNIQITMQDYQGDEPHKLLKELYDATSQRLIVLGSKKAKKAANKVLADCKKDELDEMLIAATEAEDYTGPNGAIEIRNEIERRKEK